MLFRSLLEIVEAVQTVWPADLPLFVRLSATDWTLGGWTLDETVRLCEILRKKGVDLIDCSSGGNVAAARIPVGPGYQVAFAEAVRNTGIMTSAVGLITRLRKRILFCRTGKLIWCCWDANCCANLILHSQPMKTSPGPINT